MLEGASEIECETRHLQLVKVAPNLPMPNSNQRIPLRATDLGADRTPDLVRLMSLSKLLF